MRVVINEAAAAWTEIASGVPPVWQRVGRILPRPRPACRTRRLMGVPFIWGQRVCRALRPVRRDEGILVCRARGCHVVVHPEQRATSVWISA
jgi:hypothetical protein